MEKKNKFGLVTNIILLLIIVGLVGFIVYDKSILSKDVDNDNVSNNKKQEDLISVDLKRSISKKIDYLTYKVSTSGDDYYIHNAYNFNYDLLNNSTMSNDKKLLFIISNQYERHTGLTIGVDDMELPDDNWKDWAKNGHYYEQNQITLSDVEKEYHSLFGYDDIDFTSGKSGVCPSITFDKKNQVYYLNNACGGTTGGEISSYKANYVTDGDKLYVDVYYGITVNKDNNKFDLCYDLNSDNSCKEVTASSSQVITKSNYKEFEGYRFSFKLNKDNEYNFIKVDSIKK